MVSDPIADFLIRIKNGYLAGKHEIKAPYSKIKEGIGKILEKEGYVKNIQISSTKQQTIRVKLLYKGKKAAMKEVRRVSKPGARIYADKKNLPRVLSGFGTAIISTSKGLMTDKEARKKGLGGEVICEVW